jgi:hypothetical protein
MSDALSPLSYAQLARTLPRPTAAQRMRFLEHVATMRPWAMFLPADVGVPCTLFLNPHAGQAIAPNRTPPTSQRHAGVAETLQHYREAFGYLDFSMPAADGTYILDDNERAVPLPAELIAAATCTLNATIHPTAALLLETLPLRVPAIFDAASDRLDPIIADAELREFAEQYTREELGGFLCPTDREAWASRWLQAFELLYAPRHAEQRARLERALDGLLAWLAGVDKA